MWKNDFVTLRLPFPFMRLFSSAVTQWRSDGLWCDLRTLLTYCCSMAAINTCSVKTITVYNNSKYIYRNRYTHTILMAIFPVPLDYQSPVILIIIVINIFMGQAKTLYSCSTYDMAVPVPCPCTLITNLRRLWSRSFDWLDDLPKHCRHNLLKQMPRTITVLTIVV